jgi:outer membrane protein assembly factor BamB
VCHVGVWDVNGDGQPEIVVTLKNFDLQVYSRDWRLLWKHDYALHGSSQLSFEDASGDGRPDTLFVGDRYGSVVATDSAGERLYSVYTSIGDMAYAVGDVDGDGHPEVIAGSSTGDLVCTRYPDSSAALWRFDNFGYPVKALRAADLNGDGREEVIVASGTGYLYVLDGKGQVLWEDRAGLTINDVLVGGDKTAPTLLYADEGGLLRLADSRGNRLRDLWPGSVPRLLTSIPSANGPLAVAALDSGQVVAYEGR